jgi:hypothetical protein
LERTETHGLPPALAAEIEAVGGLWWASDYYTTPEQVVDGARAARARALRLDYHDLSFLSGLPELEYLWLRSDGFPEVTPVAGVRGLRALLIETGGMRGELDPLGFPELRWLSCGLGGKLGPVFLEALQRGHPVLRSLDVHETRIRRLSELGGRFPELRRVRVSFADHLRDVGPLVDVCPRLETLRLTFAVRIESIEGLSGLSGIRTLDVTGGRLEDVGVLAGLRALRHLQLLQSRLETIEPLRNHPTLRMLWLAMARDPDPAVLRSIPGLVALAGAPVPVPGVEDLSVLAGDDPLRLEWAGALLS